MGELHYKGRGEHSVNSLETIIESLTRELEKKAIENETMLAGLKHQSDLQKDSLSKRLVAEKKLTIATEALQFYANRDNYDMHEVWGKVCIVAKDTELGVWNDFPEFQMDRIATGGKLAREALTKIKAAGE